MLCASAVPGITDRAARGPAARYVWDLADRTASRWIVPFGAAGDARSPTTTTSNRCGSRANSPPSSPTGTG
ncbi:hypothetical protein GCM10020256_39420 [Streptomyces thermocoprophilus]